MIRHRCHCGRRFLTRAGLTLHTATTHLLGNPQAAWDEHCATTPGLVSLTPDERRWEAEMWGLSL